MILRTNSHRARERVRRAVPADQITSLYDAGMKHGGVFIEVPDQYAGVLRAIPGVTKPRDQDRANYGKCISYRD